MKVPSRPVEVSVSEFKARALEFFSLIWKSGKSFTITKKGVPIAKIVSLVSHNAEPHHGRLKDVLEECGDIVSFDTSEFWKLK